MAVLGYQTKLWLVNGKGESVFGEGIAELVENVEKYHSIMESAKQLGMSYRYALHRITLAEKRLGEQLITRIRGGAKGGGFSEVTPYGKNLVRQYRKVQMELGEFLEKKQ
ncbi:MAG: LysR family transcriptional regulator [Candidatus Bathyarchaeota archaeon]|nr:LysR family transcriptional regulator [Candidatus Termiticorpusculum sp.]